MADWSFNASTDGGKSWRCAKHGEREALTVEGGDPVIAFDSAALRISVIFAHGFKISRSTDGGLTWSSPATVPGSGYDRPWLGVDQNNGHIYAAGKLPIQILEGVGERASHWFSFIRKMEDARSPTLREFGLAVFHGVDVTIILVNA